MIDVPDADSAQQIDRLRMTLKEGNLDKAKVLVQELTAGNSQLPHPEVLLARMLIETGNLSDGRRLLESLSMGTDRDFEVTHAFGFLAVMENR